MSSLLNIAAAVSALAGGFFGFQWVTTSRRMPARRSFRAFACLVLFGISVYLLYLSSTFVEGK